MDPEIDQAKRKRRGVQITRAQNDEYMEVRNKMLEEIGSEQTEENQEDEEILQKIRQKKTSKIYPMSIMMNHRNENQKRAERNLSQKLHMFIEKEAATPAVVIRKSVNGWTTAIQHKHRKKNLPSLNILLEERKKVELRQERKSMETEERKRENHDGERKLGKG